MCHVRETGWGRALPINARHPTVLNNRFTEPGINWDIPSLFQVNYTGSYQAYKVMLQG